MRSPEGTFREGRVPFCYQTLPALNALRVHYSTSKLASALGVYLCLTEAANEAGGQAARNGFSTGRKQIAEMAGVSVDTLDRYLSDFEKIGLIEVIRERAQHGGNLPNSYVLLDVPSRAGAPIPGRADAATPSRSDAAQDLEEGKPSEEGRAIALPRPPRTDAPTTVDRRKVTESEWIHAVAILAAWNDQTGGRLTPKAWAPKIIMRIREHPTLTLQDHAGVIAASLAHPWWSGPANPSVVYGNAAQFERSVLQALAPQQDSNAPMTPEEMETYRKLWGPGTPYSTLAAARAAGTAHPVIEGR